MDEPFTFTPPPECPVFRPTKEEFRDPLEYIDQIKPIAVKSGICKIIPPDDWKPPFSVNVNTFQFTPRVQKLYELEAQSRVKLNFMMKLSQFVRLQGNDKLKIPNINGKHLDLYKLHKLVTESGGYEHVTANKLWPKIASKLGYKLSNQVYTLRTHYEKILLPFDIMLAGSNDSPTYDSQSTEKPKPVLHPSTTKKRKSLEDAVVDTALTETSQEVKRLQFVGAGPRMYNGMKEEVKNEEFESGPLKRKCLSDYVCKVCLKGDKEDRLLICDNEECQESYHCECLVPPIVHIPKQSWKCQNCVLTVLNKKPVEYGFPSSSTTYSLYDFGRSADIFKANYFGKELHEIVPCSTVEKEFWRILQSFNDDVIVEYGADIHSSHQGSGFPTLPNIDNGKCALNNGEPNMDLALKYANEAWNLNNLPVNKRSILSYIRGNIDGMKIPWCYVGMVFSSFCWHIEDHWSFSINYLHWGEPKTWYGVSSDHAVQFESAMKKQAPELFENHEDLLHHITTTMNPNILQREGVPVHRTDQHAGQFVVTFPRAYHAGFNQGFNFAEAVNFCPGNWLSMGRACISHYAQLHRHCVFSHEELLCTIAEAALLERDDLPDDQVARKYPLISQLGIPRGDISIDANIRRVVHEELELVLEEEERSRVCLDRLGVTRAERRLFEAVVDDERACCVCQTTCFLSAVECRCLNEDIKAGEGTEDEHDHPLDRKVHRIACFRHLDDGVCSVCRPDQCTLLYRFSVEEVQTLLAGMEVRLQDFHCWEQSLRSLVTGGEAEGQRRGSLEQLAGKLAEGAECGFDGCEEFVNGRALLERGEDLVRVCRHWLRVVQEQVDEEDAVVPKSVLLDCARADGQMEARTVNVASLTEENLARMRQTLARFPVELSCFEFKRMVERLLLWRQESLDVMATRPSLANPAQLLPRVVRLFEEAKKLFPGWAAFSGERAFLQLAGRGLQWLVRIRECEDAVKVGKTAHLALQDALSLPAGLINDDVLLEVVVQGEALLVSLRDAATDHGDLGRRCLTTVTSSVEAALLALNEVAAEVARVREQIVALPKRAGVSAAVVAGLRGVLNRCLRMGVRVAALDEARARAYKACVEVVLSARPGRFLPLETAQQLLGMGAALFAEGVLDRDSPSLTQRHIAAKTQLAVVARAVRRLKMAFTGCQGEHGSEDQCALGCLDRDFLQVLLPRQFSADEAANRDRLARNSVQFMSAWESGVPTETHVISLMTLYQSMMVDELTSLDTTITNSDGTDSTNRCLVCNLPIIIDPSSAHQWHCGMCAPRSKRPTISDMAQMNKLLKQCPTIVSVYGVALQALSKRIVTWLESLVTIVRVNARFLAQFHPRLKEDGVAVPACIRELFAAAGGASGRTACPEALLDNLRYLGRVGRVLEVNVEAYLAVIAALVLCVEGHLAGRF